MPTRTCRCAGADERFHAAWVLTHENEPNGNSPAPNRKNRAGSRPDSRLLWYIDGMGDSGT